MLEKIYYFISSLLVLAAAFVFVTPSLLTPDLIYPDRIDSTYIAFHADNTINPDSILFNPSDVDLPYSSISLITNDALQLNGWFVHSVDTPANTIIILHNLNESKILYIDYLKQFHDRGLNVCAFDLRAHGNSGGNEFTPGLPSVEDVKLMIDSVLSKKGTRHVVLMGIGLSAAIAFQAAVYDNRCQALIVQSPFNSFENYLDRYSRTKWKIMKDIWYPVFKRRQEALLHYPIKELDLTEIATYTSIPALFIIGSDDDQVYTTETLQVFDASATDKKELFLVRNAGHGNIAKVAGELYYNRIAAFLIATLPKIQKTTRYKKLALNDQ
jgi:alpha-beta hydrolase superfamily lysophospholipase